MINIYLDIDGVLLANDLTPALHADKFLAYILRNFPDSTYWLTTHCRGDAQTPIKHIGHMFSTETVELMKKIKATNWEVAKTEAIDFSQPFLWFDDDLFDFEKIELEKYSVLENWIEVDLATNPNQLAVFLQSFPKPINDL